jgi:soluble lytic murein transglycosylase-like protein
MTSRDAFIEQTAEEFGFHPELIKAIIMTESGNNDAAIRYEPAYRYLWNVAANTPFRTTTSAEIASAHAPADFRSQAGSIATEWHGQKTSWGAMQIMGAVAREYGFKGYFTLLCGEVGIHYGCRHLSKLSSRFKAKHGMQGVIAAYNAGSPRYRNNRLENQEYVDKVISRIPIALRRSEWLK